MKTQAIAFALLFSACPHPTPPLSDAALPSRLQVVNSCGYDIWIEESFAAGSGKPDVLRLLKDGTATSYDTPAEGLASTRFWAKVGCDASGANCKIGQSSPPCPAKGCPPPADSKLEATWGCTLADKTKCAKTPQGHRIDATTWWNASAVDGYTLPYTITLEGGDGRASCVPADCAGLTFARCPTNDDLSNGGANPKYAHQDEAVKFVPDGGVLGCFSTCMKLDYPTYGGDGVQNPSGPVEKMYCCPGPMADACRAGPVGKTKYVQAVHAMCKNTVYGYAYDDGVGLRNCSADTKLTLTFGPNCP